jgi:hypothetical protein
VRSRSFNLLVAVSLVLCLTSIVLWARSYRGAERFSRTQLTIADATKTAARTHHLQWSQGLVQFWIQYQMRDNTEPYIAFLDSKNVPVVPNDLLPLNTGPMTPELARAHWSYSYLRYGAAYYGESVEPASFLNRRGFNSWDSIWYNGASTGGERRGWSIPAWLLSGVFAVLPAIWIFGIYSRRRNKLAGICVVCNYDLRASPDRCPECGTMREKIHILE